MNKTKKVLLGTMLAGAVTIGAGFGSGTFSDFTSTAKSENNKIETGNLALESSGTLFSATKKAPGYTETKDYTIHNAGSLTAKDLSADVTVSVTKDGVAVTDLTAFPEFKVTIDGQPKTLDQLESYIESKVNGQSLNANDTYTLPVKVELTHAADNTYQNLSVNVSVAVSAKAYE
ncbi:TasA family protein [Fictibacillus sp. FJAT-27399]|uniref:TasA family protein n=1 Tax=Fictibacillus sp. FJAT-27399 TaxID=1729689 RepID=UPI00078055A7|nr:TasA family protein [Fictibacillus sp. FJAT-27399]